MGYRFSSKHNARKLSMVRKVIISKLTHTFDVLRLNQKNEALSFIRYRVSRLIQLGTKMLHVQQGTAQEQLA